MVFNFGEDVLSTGLALDLCEGKATGAIANGTLRKISACQDIVSDIAKNNKVVYGINTGFGSLCTTIISPEETEALQKNILKSHSVGVGKSISPGLAKLMLILKLHSLALAHSGVSVELVNRILWHINNNIIPVVPEQGSIGASGDLAPLSHLFLPLIGLGEVFDGNGKPVQTCKVLNKNKIKPLKLHAKEGLALINGTQFISAHAVKVVEKLQNCLDNADIISAMNLEAMLGSAKPFDQRLHNLRPYEGCIYVAKRMRELLRGSEILQSHKNCGRVQDPYSIRCIPQVHGASRNAWLHLKQMLHTEINSVTDNPVIFENGETISGGNFHGQPMALPLDYAALAASEIGNISDRRIYSSLEGDIMGLPKLLMKDSGLYSGFMIPQYTSAALVSENKTHCFPASADSIPTSLGQEDHVSMGAISARKALQIVRNLEYILGIELFCACQGFDFRQPLKSSVLLNACHDYIRTKIKFASFDRIYARDIETAAQMVRNKDLIHIVNDTSKKHQLDFKNQDHELFGIY